MSTLAFFEGQIVPIADARVSVRIQALHYGTGAFGGIRAYRGEDGRLSLFRPEDHFKRLLFAAKLLQMELPFDVPTLIQIASELIVREGFTGDTYLRPLIYKTTGALGARLHGVGGDFTMYADPLGRMRDPSVGLRAMTSSWRRVDDQSLPARAKICGAYVSSAFVRSEAAAAGFDEAIVLNSAGRVAEAPAANIFIVRDGVLLTPVVSDDILEGITRRTLIELAKAQLGLAVQERSIARSELYVADEILLCGTGQEVSGVVSLDGRAIGDEVIGPITRQLQESYGQAVRGQLAEYQARWCVPVKTGPASKNP